MNQVILDDIELYKLYVDAKAHENSSDLLPNAGSQHAAIAMARLFDATKDEVRMIVGSFEGSVSDQPNYIKSIKRCIEENIKFKIILLNEPNANSSAYKLLKLKESEGKAIIIRRASPSLKQKLTVAGKENHFAVFDKDKFRFENDTEKFLAWFSFKDPETSSKLISMFDSNFE